MSKVACLGPKGTFTSQAAEKLYPGAELEYVDDVEDVFEHVKEGSGEGVVAVENSLEGSVGKTMSCLLDYDIYISGEVTLDISLCLIADEGVNRGDVKVVRSHPHALAQCRKALAGLKTQSTSSTAAAIREVKGKKDVVAVGTKEAAEDYGMKVLEDGIQDLDSQTRFIALAKEDKGGEKTSVIFALKDEPGALYNILKVFADEGINLTKIESRPSRRKLGEYLFYVDYENQGKDLSAQLKERTDFYKYLGSY
ncbi:MAG: prephenate dehydratase [Candidatus Altiarchaeales archaeon]|nr:prephenate dehydratase [Candidatus Altiarchaeales archaeon]MBD3417192.1 prephenate dehydratase [Candidatus Altiarchaeales archaeon]